MALDPATLSTVFVLLSAVLGALLLFAWALNRKVRALAWWGAAFCLSASGICLVSIVHSPPGYSVLLVANALMMLAYGALYGGCRAFNARAGIFWTGAVGVGIWLLAYPLIHDWPGVRLIVVSLIAGGYAGLSAWELGRNANRRLASRYIAVTLLLVLAAFNLCRSLLGIGPSSVPLIDAFISRWSAEMGLVLVLFVPSLAFVFLSMAKEHVEFDYKKAAFTDPLTGVPNRRAFLRNAAELVERQRDRPLSCLLFDLDNFKAINDSHGHDAGDRVLAVFGQVLATHLPKRTFGRLGGEEFGAILPLAANEAAAAAETIRRDFAAAGESVLGSEGEATVSIGCATAARITVTELLRRADHALYRAKAGGRNTVIAA